MTRLLSTTSQQDHMGRSLGLSAGVHFAFLLFLFFGLPHFLPPLPPPSVPVPFEIVDIADITNTRVKDKPEEPKPPAPPPKPEESKIAPPPPPPQPVVQQQPEPPKAPEPKPPEPKPEQAEAIAPAPKPQEKPKPPDVKPKPDMLASVLKNVEKMKPAPAPVKSPDARAQAKTQTPVPAQSAAPALSERLTISEEDNFRRQIEQHWNVPIGARDVQNMVVEVRIVVNSDRTVQSVEVVDKMRMNTDSYFRAMAESVIRAIYASSPLELPEDKYDQWKTITSDFSAKDML